MYDNYIIEKSTYPTEFTQLQSFLSLLDVAVNYIAISEALGVSPSVLAAGVAADNVICAIYFTLLFALASKIPSEASTPINGA